MGVVRAVQDPLALVVGLVTAVSGAPERLADRVDVIVDILSAAVEAELGMLLRADVAHRRVEVLGSRLAGSARRTLSETTRTELSDPLFGPIARGELLPTTAARAFGPQAWAGSRTRAGCLVSFGVDQIATLPVHAGPEIIVVLLGRCGPDFTEADLTLLRSVQPVVTGIGTLLRLPEPEVAETVEAATPPRGDASAHGLSPDEQEVLALVARGSTVGAIARRMGCSPRTVHRRLGRIYTTLGVPDRLTALSRAHELGLLGPDLLGPDLDRAGG